jgi:6-phosphofructokinase 1
VKIAVVTSGGDAAGMNAAIRAVVRAGVHLGWEVLGVRHGYAGLIRGDWGPLGARDVGGIVGSGGTVLGSARCPEFRDAEVRARAARRLAEAGVEGLVVIGGNGTQAGAAALGQLGVAVVGVASTIDDDLRGSEPTIGFTTAVDVALESIDRLRTTAASHGRVFLVEVMGRASGALALHAGLGGGAEAVVIPEVAVGAEDVAAELRAARERGKEHAIVVVAEGAALGIEELARHLGDRAGFDVRTTRLGHVQRGAAPGGFDRLLATRLGVGAVAALAAGRRQVLVGWLGGGVQETPLDDASREGAPPKAAAEAKSVDPALIALAEALAR